MKYSYTFIIHPLNFLLPLATTTYAPFDAVCSEVFLSVFFMWNLSSADYTVQRQRRVSCLQSNLTFLTIVKNNNKKQKPVGKENVAYWELILCK